MEQKKIKTGIIGFGDCSQKRFLPYLARHKGFELVAVADILDENMKLPYVQKIANSNNVKYYQLEPWNDIPKEFLKETDLIYVASPNEYHLHHINETLYNTSNFVVVEKPLVTDMSQVVPLRKNVKRCGKENRLFCQDHYVLKPPSLYASEHLKEIVEKYGKIEGAKVTFFEEGNLIGLSREKWLISPSAGGGVFIDTGVHMASILTKIAGANFTECRKANVFDMYPNRNFQCETGFYGEFLVDGEYFLPSEKSNVIMKIAKGVKNHEAKKIEFELENANLCLDYTIDNYKAVLTTEKGKEEIKLTGQEYESLVKELYSTLTERKKPFLNIDDANRSLGVVFMGYDRIGGVSNMPLERTFSVIEDFIHA